MGRGTVRTGNYWAGNCEERDSEGHVGKTEENDPVMGVS